MASVGKATLTIVPKFDNLGRSVNAALSKVDTTSSGVKMGRGVADGVAKGTGGLVKSGAIIGVFSAATAKAMDMISASVGGAVSRFDTLNNYPRVMQALGYSAEDSEASIAKMSSRLTGLPTALNNMVSTVQGITAVTGDLNLATDAGLALNDMLLSSGSSTQLVNSAMEQFRQMLSKGKPEMEDWKSLTSAMPGQMNQLAKAMLGPTANANELYAALGGGKNEAIFTMDQLLDTMIRLDVEGGEGFTSFAEQAKNATGGVESSMSNMQTAVSRGMAGVLDAIGTDTISDVLKSIGSAFEGALKAAGDGIIAFKPLANDLRSGLEKTGGAAAAFAGKVGKAVIKAEPQISGFVDHLTGIAPTAIAAAASFSAFKGAGTHLAVFASRAKESVNQSTMLKSANKLLGASFSPVSLGIAGVSAVLGLVVTGYLDAKKKSDDFRKATTGLSDAVSKAASLDEYSGRIETVGEKAGLTAMRVDELRDSMARHVDKMNETNEQAETQIAQLNAAQSIIETYTGRTDLSTEAQGRLEWALSLVNDQFGTQISRADVINGFYTDQNEVVHNLKDGVYELIEAKKKEIKIAALSTSLTEATAMQNEAADTYAVARHTYDELFEYYKGYVRNTSELRGKEADAKAATLADEMSGLSEAKTHYEDASKAVENLYADMGDVARATSETANAFDKLGYKVGPLFESTLKDRGTSLTGLKEDLRSLVTDTEENLNKLNDLSEDKLLELADVYDGTTASIVGKLQEWGIEMDETAFKSAKSAADIKAAIEGMGDEAKQALDGIDLSNFSQKLADVGISADDMSSIAQEDFAEMVDSCGGNIDELVGMIQLYNSKPVYDKEGNVVVEYDALTDAQGQIWTWNGTTFVNKETGATVHDEGLIDSQDRVYQWNGTELEYKGTRAEVFGNAVDGVAQTGLENTGGAIGDLTSKTVSVNANGNYSSAGSKIWDLGAGIRNLSSKTIDIIANVSRRNAAGGIRLNAEGGYRFHADGAIATRAVPLDIVGEDGAEAIVPLTNKRYSLPFAKVLAEQMGSARQTPANYYTFGDITIDVSSLKDIETAADFANALVKEGRSR